MWASKLLEMDVFMCADGVGSWLNNTCAVVGRNDDDQTSGTTSIRAEYRRPGHFGMLLVNRRDIT